LNTDLKTLEFKSGKAEGRVWWRGMNKPGIPPDMERYKQTNLIPETFKAGQSIIPLPVHHERRDYVADLWIFGVTGTHLDLFHVPAIGD
jgi:hypothetical protein